MLQHEASTKYITDLNTKMIVRIIREAIKIERRPVALNTKDNGRRLSQISKTAFVDLTRFPSNVINKDKTESLIRRTSVKMIDVCL